MYGYVNEDAAFERLKDLQREAENSRVLAAALQGGFARLAESIARGAARLGGLALPIVSRHHPLPVSEGGDQTDASAAA
jgi:hypothetical protein